MKNSFVKIDIPLELLRKKFPSLPEKVTLIQCSEGVCHLPMKGGDIKLDVAFLFEFKGKTYTIHSKEWMGKVMFFPEEL